MRMTICLLVVALLIGCTTPPAAAPPAPTPAPLTPVTQPPAGQYLFIETWFSLSGDGQLPFTSVDFPTYQFDSATGSLQPYYFRDAFAFRLRDLDWGVIGLGESRAGAAGSGTGSDAAPIRRLPYRTELPLLVGSDADGQEITRAVPIVLEAVASDGTVQLTLDGERVVLAPGQSWPRSVRIEVAVPGEPNWAGSYYGTSSIRNYGWQDRDKLRYQPAILRSTNGGITWTRVYTETDSTVLAELSCPTPSHCFALTGDTLLVSADERPPAKQGYDARAQATLRMTTDGGATWSAGRTLGAGVFSLSCPSAGECLALSAQGRELLATTDGGRSWAARTIAGFAGVLSLECPESGICLAGDARIRWKLLGTTDGGATWSQRYRGGLSVAAISCSDAGHCFMLAGDNVVQSIDGGVTWRDPAPTRVFAGLLSCPSLTTCFAGNDLGTFYASHDGARSWSVRHLNEELGIQSIDALSCPTEDVCFAAVFP